MGVRVSVSVYVFGTQAYGANKKELRGEWIESFSGEPAVNSNTLIILEKQLTIKFPPRAPS